MRLLLDILAALMIMCILAGVVMIKREESSEASRQELVKQELRRFQTQILLQTALIENETSIREHPRSIDPAWFKGNLPRNHLIGPKHPWCEVASEDQRHLQHPIDRTTASVDTAGFWYNPNSGVVRARVPVGVSDAKAIELYNFLNDSQLPTLFAED
jgi:hypothetical protein